MISQQIYDENEKYSTYTWQVTISFSVLPIIKDISMTREYFKIRN